MWRMELVLLTEMEHTIKTTFEMSYDTYFWVELQRKMYLQDLLNQFSK